MLVSQQYSTGDMSKLHYVILIWLIGTIPAVYVFNSVATATLLSGLIVVWLFTYLISVS